MDKLQTTTDIRNEDRSIHFCERCDEIKHAERIQQKFSQKSRIASSVTSYLIQIQKRFCRTFILYSKFHCTLQSGWICNNATTRFLKRFHPADVCMTHISHQSLFFKRCSRNVASLFSVEEKEPRSTNSNVCLDETITSWSEVHRCCGHLQEIKIEVANKTSTLWRREAFEGTSLRCCSKSIDNKSGKSRFDKTF